MEHSPSAKVPGGTDLAGDAYNANDPNSVPVPDSNPMDCSLSGGHGTGTASLIGGLGENNDGSTYLPARTMPLTQVFRV